MDEDFKLGFVGLFETVKWRFVEQVNVRYLVGRGRICLQIYPCRLQRIYNQ